MRVQDIKLGEYYRHKTSPQYGWAKALKILKPKEGVNTNTYSVVQCEWGTDKSGVFGLIKYFRPSDLIKGD